MGPNTGNGDWIGGGNDVVETVMGKKVNQGCDCKVTGGISNGKDDSGSGDGNDIG